MTEPATKPTLIPQIVRVLLLLAAATYLCPSLYDPEFYGHLAIGRWIWGHGAVPREDIWTIAGKDSIWMSTSWLFEFGLCSIENAFGERGLIIAKMLTLFFFIWSLARLYSSRAGDAFIGSFFALVVACGALARAPFEPEILGWGLLALIIEACYRFKETGRITALFTVVVASCCYVNIHSAALIALVLGAVLPLVAPRTESVAEHTNQLRPAHASLILFVAMACCQFCSPYLGGQIRLSLQSLVSPVALDIIFQAHPATIFDFGFAFLLLLWIVAAVFWHFQPAALRTSELCIAACAAVFGMCSSSSLPYAMILAGLLCAQIWGRSQGEALGDLGRSIHSMKDGLSRLAPEGVLWVILCVLFVNIYNLIRVPSVKVLLPAEEVDFILEEKTPFPLLHESAIGPYLLYRFSDELGNAQHRVALTPRAAALAPELAQAEHAMETLAPGWNRYFDTVAPKTVLCRTSSALYELMLQKHDWQIVYETKSEVKAPGRSVLRWAVFRKTTEIVE